MKTLLTPIGGGSLYGAELDWVLDGRPGLASVLYNQVGRQRGTEVGDIREAIKDRLSGAFKAMTKRLGYF